MLEKKVRGIENVAGAVLMIVIAIIGALALYLLMSNMLSSSSAPNVQLDAYQSAVFQGGRFILALKFGASYPAITQITVYKMDGTQLCTGQVTEANQLPNLANIQANQFQAYPTNQPAQGQAVYIYGNCPNLVGGQMYRVQLQFGGATNPVTISWQT